MVRIAILVIFCCALCGCGVQGWNMWAPPPSPGRPGTPEFKCNGPNSIITIEKGTQSQEADLVLTNRGPNPNTTSELVVSPRTSATGVAEILNLACSNVNLRCGFKGYNSVKVCGSIGTDFDFSISQSPPFSLTFSHADSPND